MNLISFSHSESPRVRKGYLIALSLTRLMHLDTVTLRQISITITVLDMKHTLSNMSDSVISVFLSAQRTLLQRLSRRCQGKKSYICTALKSILFLIFECLPDCNVLYPMHLSSLAYIFILLTVVSISFFNRQRAGLSCWPNFMSIGRINFIFRKLGKGI